MHIPAHTRHKPVCARFVVNVRKNFKQTPLLFCKYLRNQSSDLHEILCGSQLLSYDPCINARVRVENERTHDKSCARTFTPRACLSMHGSSSNLTLTDRRSLSRAMRLFLLEKEMHSLGKTWTFDSYSAKDDTVYNKYLI